MLPNSGNVPVILMPARAFLPASCEGDVNLRSSTMATVEAGGHMITDAGL